MKSGFLSQRLRGTKPQLCTPPRSVPLCLRASVLKNKMRILWGYTRLSSKLGVEKSGSGLKERIEIRSTPTPKHYTYNSFLFPLEIGNGNWQHLHIGNTNQSAR